MFFNNITGVRRHSYALLFTATRALGALRHPLVGCGHAACVASASPGRVIRSVAVALSPHAIQPMETRKATQVIEFQRTVRLVLVGLAVACLMKASQASAHFIGNSWSHTSGSLVQLEYGNFTTGTYSTAVSNAVSAWNATATPIYFYPPGPSCPCNVDISTYTDQNSGNWGVTAVYNSGGLVNYQSCTTPCSVSGGTYTYTTITLNTATFPSLSTFMQQKVATHELGHSTGLNHTSCTAIMQQGTVSWNTPQPHDTYDENLLYPGSFNPPSSC